MPIVAYSAPIEHAIERITTALCGDYSVSERSIALFLLAGDEEITSLVAERDSGTVKIIDEAVAEIQEQFVDPIAFLLALRQRESAERLVRGVIVPPTQRPTQWRDRISQAMINPLTGLPILFVALLALYWFVGVFGAQTLVDWLERVVFGQAINPWINHVVNVTVPWPAIRALLAGEYGILTLGVRYAIAIILPIVGTFFLIFAVIEDSGYLPRLALLIDRVFKKIGLNGRAVIPMVLGFGCDTMATIVTRTLETRRERLISTFLLALAIPCSAQLGVIFAILAGSPAALGIWAVTVLFVFLLVGFLAAKLMPGERPHFYMELPPLRAPRITNVLVKTYTRMEWYLKEVLPLFILASVLIWLGQTTGLFDLAVHALQPAVRLMGLPDESAVAFLFGFFRRDYGAAGLYDVQSLMSGVQLAVAAVTLTLFVPCVAQFSVMLKERGWKTAVSVVAFIFPFAFLVGWALNMFLALLEVSL
jgi:ferrous iron transport protein B